jgi:hypothetical protein
MRLVPAPGTREPLSGRLDELDRRLSAVLQPLGFAPRQLEEGEGTDLLQLENPSWPAAQAARLPFPQLVELAVLCEGAFAVELIYGGARLLSITPQTEAQAFDDLRRRAERLQGENLTVLLQLRKRELLDAWDVRGPHAVFKLFLRHEALARALRVPLEDLERGLFASSGDGAKRIFLVLDRPLALDGDHLALVGERFLADWRRFLPAAAPDLAPLRAMHAGARESLRWVSLGLERLTPLHLLVRWPELPGPPWNAAVEALHEKLLALALVYMADRTTRQDGGMVCLFGAERHSAEVRIPDAPGVAADLWGPAPREDLVEQIAALAEMALWVYEGSRGTSDRLQVVRRVVAQDLYGTAPAAAPQLLASRAVTLRRHAEWSWQTFMEGKLDTYFDRVEKLEKVVDETAGKVDEQIRGLNKALADSMLGVVAAAAASFIAAMFRPGSSRVLQIGLLVYAGYLLIFPCAASLTSAMLQFRETWDAFQDRLSRGFGERLFSETVPGITGDRVAKAGRRFKGWWWVTLAAYLLVIAALCAAAWKAPSLVPPPPKPVP